MDQMLLQMTGMGLAQPAGGPHDQHVHHYSNSTPSLAPKRQRFKKISTVSISVFDGKSIEEVHLLLASWSAVVASEIKPTERGSSHAHAHAQGRRVYKHVKSTRQQNPTGGQPGSSDKGPFLVLDVICMDSETSYSDAGVNEKKLLEEARKVKEERERQLMTSFLPMVGEFLEGQKAQGESKRSQRKVPSSSRGAGGSSREGQHKDHPEGSVPTPTSTSTSTPTPTPPPLDFVYDVYLPAPTPMDEEGGPGDEHTPVIEVDDDEMWYEDPVDDESEAGKSEDSNAESYYANRRDNEHLALGSVNGMKHPFSSDAATLTRRQRRTQIKSGKMRWMIWWVRRRLFITVRVR